MNKLAYTALLLIPLFNAYGMTQEEKEMHKGLKRLYANNNKEVSCAAMRNGLAKKDIPRAESALAKKKKILENKQQTTPPNKSKHANKAFFYGACSLAFSGFGLYNLYQDNNFPNNIGYYFSATLGIAAFLPKTIHHALKWHNYEKCVNERMARTDHLTKCLTGNRDNNTPQKKRRIDNAQSHAEDEQKEKEHEQRLSELWNLKLTKETQ